MKLTTVTIRPSQWTEKYQAQLSDAIIVEVDDIPELLSLALLEARQKLESLETDDLQIVTVNDDGTTTVEAL